ncbi:MAG: DUF1343 domain-containing protein [Gemmatimonadetes bacterium]|nr:DUF1343 domain-containing protein [Gemmatimonadota bacterium]
MKPNLHASSLSALVLAALAGACAEPTPEPAAEPAPAVRPGISVLLDDSIHLIQGKKIGLITNQAGLDEDSVLTLDLLASGDQARAAGVQLVALFAPEHGIRGTEDRDNLPDEVDATTGLAIHSLYGDGTRAPADSLLKGLDALVVDLQDIGTRVWTYTGLMLYSLRAGARNGIPVLVLDRPNPINGVNVEGPILDSLLADVNDPPEGGRGKAHAHFPVPLRFGLTMGELARLYNDRLALGTDLKVIPMSGWTRDMWWEDTGLPWVKPSPNLPSLTSIFLFPATVHYEALNTSVGRGTDAAFQRIGAPWMDNVKVAELLNGRGLPGLRVEAERFTPVEPTDEKFPGVDLPGVKIVVTDRSVAEPSRVAAALLWALVQTTPDSLVFRIPRFDEHFGAARLREAIVAGADPDSVLAGEKAAVDASKASGEQYKIYM